MALDPNIFLASLVQNAGASGDAYVESQQNALRTRMLQSQLGQVEAAQRQQQAYQAATQDYLSAPTPDKLMALATQFPEQAKSLSDAWKLKEDAQRDSDRQWFAQVYSAANRNRKDLLVQQLRQRRDAEHGRGLDTAELDDVIRDLDGPDGDLESVKGYALAHIYAGDPDNFAKAFNIGGEGSAPKVLGYGDALVKPDGTVVYQSPDAPFTLNAGETRYANPQPGGGGLASGTGGASAPSGRFTGGWTPRARNGGDNADDVVDNKIGGMVGALGIGADTPFPAGMSNMDIAKALTLSEGGPGSLADRNNNPGNLIDPKTGGFRKFPTKEAGLQAAAAQVARNRSRGQTSIRSMVEGLPVGQGGGARAVASAPAKPEAGATRMTPQEVAAEGLDPNTVYYRNKDGVPQAVSGQDTRRGSGRQVPMGLQTKIEGEVDQLVGLKSSLSGFKDAYGGHTITGDASNWAQAAFGTGEPGQRDWWAQFRAIDNVIRNGLFGASLTDGEKKAYESTTVTPSMKASEIRKNLQTRVGILQKALARRKKTVLANKYDADAVDALFDTGELQEAAPTQGGGQIRIIRVRPK